MSDLDDTPLASSCIGIQLYWHPVVLALEVAALTGVRLVLVHAKDSQAANFYRHFGFEPSPMDDLILMLLVKDIEG